mmetsp:Transcript_16339/g.24754  ORF Transcript_16339/g.24754 Transcript_16339/m.24754 type:complete len:142 (-) Transcript_16339:530-955(-)
MAPLTAFACLFRPPLLKQHGSPSSASARGVLPVAQKEQTRHRRAQILRLCQRAGCHRCRRRRRGGRRWRRQRVAARRAPGASDRASAPEEESGGAAPEAEAWGRTVAVAAGLVCRAVGDGLWWEGAGQEGAMGGINPLATD